MLIYRILILSVLLLLPSASWAAIAFVSSVSAGSPDSHTFTTGTLDSSGANLLVCGISQTDGTANAVITDSKSNTWLTTPTTINANSLKSFIVFAKGATVGSGHTFTVTGAAKFASIGCLAFSGADTITALDVENGASAASGTSLAAGSIAAATGAVAVTVINPGIPGATPTIDTGFTKQENIDLLGAAQYPMAIAYKLSSGTTNPTWSWTGSSAVTIKIASFLANATVTNNSLFILGR